MTKSGARKGLQIIYIQRIAGTKGFPVREKGRKIFPRREGLRAAGGQQDTEAAAGYRDVKRENMAPSDFASGSLRAKVAPR